MQQLDGLDAGFLALENRTTVGHVTGVLIVDPATVDSSNGGGPFGLARVRQLLESRMHLLPLRQRLATVPYDLDRPYWVNDPEFCLDNHLHQVSVPDPGDDRAFADFVARFHARRLDRSRPLWDMLVVDGLSGGRMAVVTKIHHAAIDGVSGQELLGVMVDLEPDPPDPQPGAHDVWVAEELPDSKSMALRAGLRLATQPLRSARIGWQLATSLPGVEATIGQPMHRLLGRAADDDGRRVGAPRTSFNHTIGAKRSFAFTSVPLSSAKRAKNTYGTTVNDVVLAMCGGVLRRWLDERGELPERSLLAMVPVSVRGESTEAKTGSEAPGNSVSSLVVPLHTDIADPVQRLHRIHDEMADIKEAHAALPATVLTDITKIAPPAVVALAARVVAGSHVAELVNPLFNVVISNVPGPDLPLYFAGAKIQANFPVSAIVDGAGLNITVQSLNGKIDIGLVGCRNLLPDLWPMVELFKSELAALT